MTIEGRYAVLDITRGRNQLKRQIESGQRIPIVIQGTIDGIHGHDDGTSREFIVDVARIEIGTPEVPILVQEGRKKS